MRTKTILTLDIVLIISTLILVVIGIIFIYSSGISSTGIVFSKEYIRQIIWAGTGIVLMMSIAFLDYQRLRRITPYLFGLFILMLVLTLLFGEVVNGARSWFGLFNFGIQPSEFAKITTILMVAAYYAHVGKKVDTLPHFILGFAITALPMFLIFLQPDMGTASIYLPIFLVISFFAGVKMRYIVFVILAGILFIGLSILPFIPSVTAGNNNSFIFNFFAHPRAMLYGILILFVITALAFTGFKLFKKKYFFWVYYAFLSILVAAAGSIGTRLILKDYQIERLIVFLNPDIDPQGAGWNIIQSITAVGSGGFTGKGFLQGTQSHYQYLPQQSTDFIFSIIAEEWGFLGILLIFALYLVVILKSVFIVFSIKDRFGVYVGMGIVGMFLFHFIVNIGMAVGIMPITGIPLIFLSYGGSSLWTGLIGIGLLLSIYRKRESF